MKVFNLGFVIGRFQHLHDGHCKMIQAGLDTCERLLLIVGSSQEAFTERNPFTLKTRMDLIRDVYNTEIFDNRLLLAHIDDLTNENDHSKEWGDFLLNKIDMWSQHYGLNHKPDCIIFGNDEGRMDWFRPEKVAHMNQIILGRPESEISATKMREFIVNDDFDSWQSYMPDNINREQWFNRLQEELLNVEHYNKKGSVFFKWRK